MSIEFRLYDNRTPFQNDPVQSGRERNPEALGTKGIREQVSGLKRIERKPQVCRE